jgi:hypothetical protein
MGMGFVGGVGVLVGWVVCGCSGPAQGPRSGHNTEMPTFAEVKPVRFRKPASIRVWPDDAMVTQLQWPR